MNELARLAVLAGDESTFPAGATIVREKLISETDVTPEALAVMIKREKGFNPDAGDWEFLMINGSVKKIQKREKKGECLTCHSSEKKKDFVFRYYE